jgi:hypothetical protein
MNLVKMVVKNYHFLGLNITDLCKTILVKGGAFGSTLRVPAQLRSLKNISFILKPD